jgi:predicted flap endonuclease-1-like 5' DNA nuclease
MRQSENKRAPSLGGWVIAAAAGLVAAAVAFVVGHFGYIQSGFIGAIVFLVVGLILGMYWGAPAAAAPKPAVGAPTVAPVATPVRVDAMPAATLTATPAMAEPMPAPAMVAAPQPIVVAAIPAAAPAASTSVSGPAAMFTAAPPATAAPAKPVVAAKPKAPAKPAAAKAAAKPAAVAAKPAAAKVPKAPKVAKPTGPVRLTGPRKGKADDLKEIEGIGPVLEKLCHSLGFYHFDQLAGWSDADVALVDGEMKTFKGRIVRDKWVPQAKIIVTEGLEAFRVRAQTNNY